jgi:hypothetical protein
MAMDEALFEFYSKPVEDPEFWSAKSLFFRFLFPILPHVGHVVQETVEDFMTEQRPFTQSLISNVKQEVSSIINNERCPIDYKQSDVPPKRKLSQPEDDRRPKRARSV